MVIDKDTKDTILNLQKTLRAINNKQKVFFNITQYQKLGLIHGIKEYYIDACGNKQVRRTNWFLTDKAKQFINVTV